MFLAQTYSHHSAQLNQPCSDSQLTDGIASEPFDCIFKDSNEIIGPKLPPTATQDQTLRLYWL